MYLDAVGLAHTSASSAISDAAAQHLSGTDPSEVLPVSARHFRPRPRPTPQFWWYEDEDYWYEDDLRRSWSDWTGPSELSTVEAAMAFGVTPATVRQWVRRGHLVPLRRQGRTLIFGSRSVYQAAMATAERNRQPSSASPRMGQLSRVAGTGISGRLMQANVTAAQAAQLIGVSEATIRSWAHRGYINPSSRLGRTPYYRVAAVVAVARREPYRPPRKGKPLL